MRETEGLERPSRGLPPTLHERAREIAEALARRIEEVGIVATAQEIGISIKTLRRLRKDAQAPVFASTWSALQRWMRYPQPAAAPCEAKSEASDDADPLLEEMRASARESATQKGIRAVANEAGVRHSSLHRFLATPGSKLYGRNRRRLEAWHRAKR